MKDFIKRYKYHLLIGLLLNCFIGILIFVLYFTDLFILKEIRVLNAKKVSKEEVIKLTGLKGGERLFGIDLRKLKDKLKEHPSIEEVIIARRLPSLLEISVKEREGLAIVIKENRGYLIDRRGVIIGGIIPEDYFYYPVVEVRDESWKETFFTFLFWLKNNKNYLPVYENYSNIILERDKIVFHTKNHINIYFPLRMLDDLTKLYQNLDRIMVYLYENNLVEKVELIRVDYPYGQALIKFRS